MNVLLLLLAMFVPSIVKQYPLGKSVDAPSALGSSRDLSMEPDNYWVELQARVTLGSLVGGSSPAWAADAGDRLVKEFIMNLGGSLNPIKASARNLKILHLLDHGEELPADGYLYLPFRGAFPAHVFENGIKFSHVFESLANLTTGSPTSQTGTKVDWSARIFPRQGKPEEVRGFPIIKTFEVDLQSVAGRKVVLNLNSGNKLKHLLMIPSSGTLVNRVEVSVANGEDVWRDVAWAELAQQNKKDYFLDAAEGAAGWRAFTFPSIPTGKNAVGRLDLWADINGEASGKMTVVTLEYMSTQDEQKLLAKLVEK